MTDVVIHIGRRKTKAQHTSEKILEQFVDREEYPEMFGEEDKFDFDIEHEGTAGLMTLEEFDEKLDAYKDRIAKEREESIEKKDEGIGIFKIIED